MNATPQPSTRSPQWQHRPVFVTTRWSVVLAAREKPSAQAEEALDILCRDYWSPLYAFIRRRGFAPADAQDLTQEFFARLLAKDYLKAVGRDQGRFRTFLLTALKRFLANEWDKSQAQKRGGGIHFVSFDPEGTEPRYAGADSLENSPEHVFDRQWALTLIDRVFERLREDYQAMGKGVEFERLKPCLTTDRGEIRYSQLAERLGVSEGAARVAAHRVRRRFRSLFREEVARTVAIEEDVEDELRYLMRALS